MPRILNVSSVRRRGPRGNQSANIGAAISSSGSGGGARVEPERSQEAADTRTPPYIGKEAPSTPPLSSDRRGLKGIRKRLDSSFDSVADRTPERNVRFTDEMECSGRSSTASASSTTEDSNDSTPPRSSPSRSRRRKKKTRSPSSTGKRSRIEMDGYFEADSGSGWAQNQNAANAKKAKADSGSGWEQNQDTTTAKEADVEANSTATTITECEEQPKQPSKKWAHMTRADVRLLMKTVRSGMDAPGNKADEGLMAKSLRIKGMTEELINDLIIKSVIRRKENREQKVRDRRKRKALIHLLVKTVRSGMDTPGNKADEGLMAEAMQATGVTEDFIHDQILIAIAKRKEVREQKARDRLKKKSSEEAVERSTKKAKTIETSRSLASDDNYNDSDGSDSDSLDEDKEDDIGDNISNASTAASRESDGESDNDNSKCDGSEEEEEEEEEDKAVDNSSTLSVPVSASRKNDDDDGDSDSDGSNSDSSDEEEETDDNSSIASAPVAAFRESDESDSDDSNSEGSEDEDDIDENASVTASRQNNDDGDSDSDGSNSDSSEDWRGDEEMEDNISITTVPMTTSCENDDDTDGSHGDSWDDEDDGEEEIIDDNFGDASAPASISCEDRDGDSDGSNSDTSEESSAEEATSEEEEEVVVRMKRKSKKKKKKKKDPNKPKRNLNAFFLYSKAYRERVKVENPEAKFGDIAKILSSEFKSLDARERSQWDDLAEKDKERYLREMENYVPPSDDCSEDIDTN